MSPARRWPQGPAWLGCVLLGGVLLGGVLLGGCGATARPPRVEDLSGALVAPTTVPAGKVHVLVFTSHECPIANAYAPTLRALAQQWRDQAVNVFLVHCDPDLTAATARDHAAAYDLPGCILLDPHHDLVHQLGIEKTPEAAVVTEFGLVYRGRIDDQWQALGARTAAANQHDLANAVAATLKGQPAQPARTPVVGCLLPTAKTR